MSGIYLYFDPEGVSDAGLENFRETAKTRITRVPGKSVDLIRGEFIAGAAAHYGIMPSGGVTSKNSNYLISTGSCWIDSDSDCLATPDEILAAWESGPRETRAPFGGIFALAHCDSASRELIVESDRFSALPVYFRPTGRGLVVSTEIKFLTGEGNETVDQEALADMFAIGYISRQHTLLKEVHRLPPHSRLICNSKGWRIVSLPNIGYPRNRKVDREVIAEYDAIVQRSLKRYADLTDHYCISLSGGLDSRILAAAAQRAGLPLHAFSIGESGSLDASMAKKVAELLDIPIDIHQVDGSGMADWFSKMVWFTEGRVLPAHMHYMTANFSQSVPAGPQLHGLIGEAHIGGPFDDFSLVGAPAETIRRACQKVAKTMIYWPDSSISETFAGELSCSVKTAKDRSIDSILDRIGFAGTYSNFLDFKFRWRVEGFTVPCLISQVLPWSDVVSPFLDTDAFDFGARLEHEQLIDRAGQIKWGLQHMPIIGQLPRVKDGVVIPVRNDDPEAFERAFRRLMWQIKAKQLVCRMSMGRINLSHLGSFPIYSQWYRKWRPVREFVDGVLLSERCLDRGLFRRRGLKKLLHDCRIGRHTWGAIGTILLVEIFLRQFLDGTDLPSDPVVPLGMEP